MKRNNLHNNMYIDTLKKISLIFFLVLPFISYAQTTDTYTSSGTWTCPAGVTSATVGCWGAGGGGATMTSAGKGGGGGGGAYSSAVVSVTPGNNYTITVGLGGNPGVGGNSSFTTLVIAVGGAGVAANNSNGGNGGQASACTGTTRYNGGNGGTGSASSGGGGGGAGSTGVGGNGGDGTAGIGTPNNGGDGGAGVGGNTNGNNGNLYGGGGSGASKSGGSNRTGGSGANGLVTITYTVATPKCPSATSVAPSGTQTLCQNSTATQLAATPTYSGNTGTPTLQYQWYYNSTNSNTISGATTVSGATSSTYTPPTTTTGTRYYFCVCYAADNGCGQTSTTQSLASGTVQVTINTTPTAVTVSGGGTFCGSAILTASGGTGGTIYFQGTTSNGTSTADATNPKTVTSTGTYYFRANAGTCWGTQGSAVVTINANPTITLGAGPTVCKGVTTSNMIYTGTTGSPNQYSINYDATAEAQGFVDVTNVVLTTSPIVLTVPAGANQGIYNFTVSVRNSTTGCVSGTYSKTIEVLNPAPAQPGAISGTVNVSPATSGLVYSISAVNYATTYTWSVPVGWSITAGQGTTTMTCTSGALGQNGNISVTAGNSCGTSSASTLAVQVVDLPTITLGTSPTVCQGTTTADLTYSATTGSPNRYTIDWDITAEGQGFVDVAYTNLPASPIVLVVPGAAVTGTYNGILKVKNQAAGIESLGYNISVTIIATPATPGSISGSPSVTPTTTGLVYSISSVPSATSYTWTVPAGWSITAGQGTTSITVTSGNVGDDGNITVTASNSCGTSSAQTLAVTVQAAAIPPTITLGSNPTVCRGTTTANLTYSATTNSPDKYSINYYSASEAQGFVDVTNANLTASPIVLVVPALAAVGTYFGVLTVKNSTTGAISQNYTISVTVIDVPAVPGTISGTATANQNTSYNYSVAAVPSATSYIWTVPTGWTITAGATTNNITVLSGTSGQNGNITVKATNSCGTSTASSKAVTCIVPGDHANYTCNGCHLYHNAPGVTLTNTAGNALLCQSCHVSGGAASAKAMPNSSKAIVGVSGTSHSWAVAAVNASVEAGLPTNQAMLDRIDAGNIICSTCHDQHNPNTYGMYLRISNTGDAVCKNCHSVRNVGRWIDNNVTNKGSHPVGLTYNGGSGSLLASPTAPLQLVSGKIECSSCHQTHYSTSTNGYLLRTTNANSGDVLCTSCHSYSSHNSQGCKVCHYTHSTNKNNIYMIRNTIATPNSGNKTVVFTAETGTNSFADGDATYDGVCEVCHTTTSHFQNDGTSADQNHTSSGGPQNGKNCTGCHPHSNNFTPAGGGCDGCHNAINTPTAGIYTTDAHSTHVTRYGYACNTCHFGQGSGGSSEPTHPSGGLGEVTFDPNGLAKRNGLDAAVPSYNTTGKTCTNVYCHSDGRSAYRGTDGTDTWSSIIGSQAATYATTPGWYTGTITSCSSCHSGSGNMTSPYTITTPGLADPLPPATGSHQRGAHTSNSQELSGNGWAAVNCFWCHNTNSGKSNTPMNQGTYGTSYHVDGLTYFKPRSVVDGGTMVGANASTGVGSFSYSKLGSAAHCGQGKQCW